MIRTSFPVLAALFLALVVATITPAVALGQANTRHLVSDPSDFLLLSEDGEMVLVDAQDGAVRSLYAYPAAGGAPITLATDVCVGAASSYHRLVGQRLVWVEQCSRNEVWTVEIDGASPAVQIGDMGDSPYPLALSPDGDRIVFASDPDPTAARLWSAPVDGTPAVALTAAAPGAELEFLYVFADDLLVYRERTDTGAGFEDRLWSVPIDGSAAPTLLSGTMTAEIGSGIHWTKANFGADTWILWTARTSASAEMELWSIVLPSGSRRKVTASLDTESWTDVEILDVRGGTVYYRADVSADGAYDLYTANYRSAGAIDHTAWTAVSGGDSVGGALARFDRVVYVLAHPGGRSTLWTQTSSGASAVRYGPTLGSQGTLTGFAADDLESPTWFALAFDRFGSGDVGLYSAPVDASSWAEVSGPDTTGVGQMHIVGNRILFEATDPTLGLRTWSSTADGTGLVELGPGEWNNFYDSTYLRISEDEKYVTFRLTTGPIRYELFRGSVDGALPLERLHAPLTTQFVSDYQLFPDGSRVVYSISGPQLSRDIYLADDGRALLEIDPAPIEIEEGADPVVLPVRLTQARIDPVFATVDPAGDATPGDDFVVSSDFVEIVPGAVTPFDPLSFTAHDDGEPEPNETATIELVDPVGNALGNASVDVTILDPSGPGSIFADGFESGDISAR